MIDLRILNDLGRGVGKTTVLAEAAKKIDAVLLCPSKEEAERVAQATGCRTAHLYQEMRGTRGPVLVDTFTVSFVATKFMREIAALKAENEKLKEFEWKYKELCK